MVFRTYSGYPINETIGTDVNGDGTSNDRPQQGRQRPHAPDPCRRSIHAASPSATASTESGKTILDGRFQVRLHGCGRYQPGFFLEVYNLTNHNNFGNPTGARNSANFMKEITIDNPRTAQLGFRLLF